MEKNPLRELTEIFKDFPGIGERQAGRFAHFLAQKTNAYRKNLSMAIEEVSDLVSVCQTCHRLFTKRNDGRDRCDRCEKFHEKAESIIVVEKDADLTPLERIPDFHGVFFVLGGTVPLIEENVPSFVRSKELLKLVEKMSSEKTLKEVILAFSLTTNGEYTEEYISKILSSLSEKYNFKVTKLGRGLSTGSELEYCDRDTIKSAFLNRN